MRDYKLTIPRGCGVIYGLLDSLEPLQIRYIGQTATTIEGRLQQHIRGASESKNQKVKWWFQEMSFDTSRIAARALGVYWMEYLNEAEIQWIQFYQVYCDILNIDLLQRRKPKSNRQTWPIREAFPISILG